MRLGRSRRKHLAGVRRRKPHYTYSRRACNRELAEQEAQALQGPELWWLVAGLLLSFARDPPWPPRRAESKNHPIRCVHEASNPSVVRGASTCRCSRAHAWVGGRLVCCHVVARAVGARSTAGRRGRSHKLFFLFLPACMEAERRAGGRRPHVRRGVCVQRRCDVRGGGGGGRSAERPGKREREAFYLPESQVVRRSLVSSLSARGRKCDA